MEKSDGKSKERRGGEWPMITGEKKAAQIFLGTAGAARGIPRCDVPPNMDSFSVRPHGLTLVIHSAIGRVARRNNHELPKKA